MLTRWSPARAGSRMGRCSAGKAFNHADPAAGLRMPRDLARQLETRWPDAAASLRERLEEMFTVRRLGVGDRLARTLTSTKPIESMISVGRSTTQNVKRWRDGTMVKRWAAAGMLNGERSFRRVKGCREMPKLVEALRTSRRSRCHTLMRQCEGGIEAVAATELQQRSGLPQAG